MQKCSVEKNTLETDQRTAVFAYGPKKGYHEKRTQL